MWIALQLVIDLVTYHYNISHIGLIKMLSGSHKVLREKNFEHKDIQRRTAVKHAEHVDEGEQRCKIFYLVVFILCKQKSFQYFLYIVFCNIINSGMKHEVALW